MIAFETHLGQENVPLFPAPYKRAFQSEKKKNASTAQPSSHSHRTERVCAPILPVWTWQFLPPSKHAPHIHRGAPPPHRVVSGRWSGRWSGRSGVEWSVGPAQAWCTSWSSRPPQRRPLGREQSSGVTGWAEEETARRSVQGVVRANGLVYEVLTLKKERSLCKGSDSMHLV